MDFLTSESSFPFLVLFDLFWAADVTFETALNIDYDSTVTTGLVWLPASYKYS